jgi:hypothetical protein
MKIKLNNALIGTLLLLSQLSFAVDWVSLQGLEGVKKEQDVKIWGFLEPEYAYTDGTELKAGPYAGQEAAFNQIRPNNDTNSTFNVFRARLGVRGQWDYNKINYFFLTEFGNNGITVKDGPQLTDASVTLNYIKNMHIRFGQFKSPQGNEAQKAIHIFDWNRFSNATDRLLLERFTDGNNGLRPDGNGGTNDVANGLNGPVGAFRDVGVQFFNTFTNDSKREFTYAVMFGNGNGIARGDNDSNKDVYILLSTEQVYGGRGPRRQGFKTYAWYNGGKRTLKYVNGVEANQEFDRTRFGVGTTYRKDKIRFSAEYVWADGMIFNGSEGGAVPGTSANNPNIPNPNLRTASLNYLTDNKSDGYQLDFGYKVIPKLELAVRYDVLNNATDGLAAPGSVDPSGGGDPERTFETFAVGAQYFFTKKTRAIFNYEFRNAEAPNQASDSTANKILDGMDNRLTFQILHIF